MQKVDFQCNTKWSWAGYVFSKITHIFKNSACLWRVADLPHFPYMGVLFPHPWVQWGETELQQMQAGIEGKPDPGTRQ